MAELSQKTANLPALSVTELNKQVKSLLEASFMQVSITGEVSNFSAPSSGHWYFSLKDAKAQVRCAMFRNANLRCKMPKNGDAVVVKARVSLYEGRGEYQLIVNSLEPVGTGELLLAFEALKKKLTAEGLFAADKKRPIPTFPKKVAVVTSGTGAAIRDVISVLGRRFPLLAVDVAPVPVQGVEAAPAIIRALQMINRRERHDVVLLVRGGGSLEDLWSFNDEKLARTIAASAIPIVSGVGHETDFTICDFVADLRAPTPSAAAESIAPDQSEWLAKFQQLESRFSSAMRRHLRLQADSLDKFQKRLIHPQRRLEDLGQRLDELELRLQQQTRKRLETQRQQLNHLLTRLNNQHPQRQIEQHAQQLGELKSRLNLQIQTDLRNKQATFQRVSDLLQSVGPMATLSRGYSITIDEQGNVVRSADQVAAGAKLITRLKEGQLTSVVQKDS